MTNLNLKDLRELEAVGDRERKTGGGRQLTTATRETPFCFIISSFLLWGLLCAARSALSAHLPGVSNGLFSGGHVHPVEDATHVILDALLCQVQSRSHLFVSKPIGH